MGALGAIGAFGAGTATKGYQDGEDKAAATLGVSPPQRTTFTMPAVSNPLPSGDAAFIAGAMPITAILTHKMAGTPIDRREAMQGFVLAPIAGAAIGSFAEMAGKRSFTQEHKQSQPATPPKAEVPGGQNWHARTAENPAATKTLAKS